jgi:xanthosine phosphorylase
MTAPLAAAEILRRAPGFKPRVGIVLGSGLGSIAAHVEDAVVIPYSVLPGFPVLTVEGHAGRVTIGRLAGVDVAIMQGRHHAYEGEDRAALRIVIRTFKQLGCDTLFLTGAAGSLRPNLQPGHLLALTDHLNLMGTNPMIGPNDQAFGPRFFDLHDAYDPGLRGLLEDTAGRIGIQLESGVYAATIGPNFETPAEARMLRGMGADVVGMAVVPECIVARHCGLKVVGIVVVTSWGEGIGAESPHGPSIHVRGDATDDLERLLIGFLDALNESWTKR